MVMFRTATSGLVSLACSTAWAPSSASAIAPMWGELEMWSAPSFAQLGSCQKNAHPTICYRKRSHTIKFGRIWRLWRQIRRSKAIRPLTTQGRRHLLCNHLFQVASRPSRATDPRARIPISSLSHEPIQPNRALRIEHDGVIAT